MISNVLFKKKEFCHQKKKKKKKKKKLKKKKNNNEEMGTPGGKPNKLKKIMKKNLERQPEWPLYSDFGCSKS